MTDKKSEKKEKKDDIYILLKEIKKLNNINNNRKSVILKSILSGFFTTLGATFGFTIFLFLLGIFSSLIGRVPFISGFYESSGIKKIIEYQLEQINRNKNIDKQIEPTITPTPTNEE